jgi:hypothetical protein
MTLAHWRALAPAAAMFKARKRPQTIIAAPAHGVPTGPNADHALETGTGDSLPRWRHRDTGQKCGWRTRCVVEHSRRLDRDTTSCCRVRLPRRSRIVPVYRMNNGAKSSEVLRDARSLRNPSPGSAKLCAVRHHTAVLPAPYRARGSLAIQIQLGGLPAVENSPSNSWQYLA